MSDTWLDEPAPLHSRNLLNLASVAAGCSAITGQRIGVVLKLAAAQTNPSFLLSPPLLFIFGDGNLPHVACSAFFGSLSLPPFLAEGGMIPFADLAIRNGAYVAVE